jgi:hypothetical protein
LHDMSKKKRKKKEKKKVIVRWLSRGPISQ